MNDCFKTCTAYVKRVNAALLKRKVIEYGADSLEQHRGARTRHAKRVVSR